MTRKEIIRMAREAGCEIRNGHAYAPFREGSLDQILIRFAAAEREACAKVCDDIDREYDGEDVLATWCANAIRARGEV